MDMFIRGKTIARTAASWTVKLTQGSTLDTDSRNLLKKPPESVSQYQRWHLFKPFLICHYSCEQSEAQINL